ncbi:hypothetical protein KDA14_03365 [Candidatus Saccharibacteria bacterium]|nr:hypothetical protein [Candidatus Saccharibacteria bacterium]
MDDQKQQLIAKLKESQNVLVTVSKNPSVDQLSAAIGLTLALNKLNKHATAVYSGETPSTLEFLKPEETLETNTDSLRDFIIALDKSKADKLRYKVEDQVVRIFITPYHTSISEKDLDFSQGDFNVDVVVALGVSQQQDIDDAIQAHGRILHDAVVSSVAVEGQPELGTLNVVDTSASSLSEVIAGLIEQLDKSTIDGQIATALLTGIVATTERFSNDHTSPETMNVSARLMSAGANQQLIVSELEAVKDIPEDTSGQQVDESSAETPPKDPGTLEIHHGGEPDDSEDEDEDDNESDAEPEVPEMVEDDAPQVHVDEDGRLITDGGEMLPKIGEVHGQPDEEMADEKKNEPLVTRQRMVEPPSRDGKLTANTEEEGLGEPTENLTKPSDDLPLLSHESEPAEVEAKPEVQADAEPAPETPEPEMPEAAPAPVSVPEPEQKTEEPAAVEPPVPAPAPEQPVEQDSGQTLADLEKSVHSPHVDMVDEPPASPVEPTAQAEPEAPEPVVPNGVDDTQNALEDAQRAVEAALKGGPAAPDPIAALNAQPLGPDLHPAESAPEPGPAMTPAPGFGDASAQPEQSQSDMPDMTMDMPVPGQMPTPATPVSAFPGSMPAQSQDNTLPPPPPVPPPPIIPS